MVDTRLQDDCFFRIGVRPDSIQVLGEATELVRKLETWSNYFFNEFLARTGDVLARPAGAALDRLIDPLTVRCPECATAFLGRRGEVGVTEEQKPKP